MLVDNKSLGSNIRKCRQGKKMTMKQLAAIVGVSEQAISQYELGKRTIKIELLRKIATALNVPLADFVLDADDLNLATADDYDVAEIELLKSATPELLTDRQRKAIRIYDETISQGVEIWKEYQKKHLPKEDISFSFPEHALLKDYRRLNAAGKEYLLRTVKMLIGEADYTIGGDDDDK